MKTKLLLAFLAVSFFFVGCSIEKRHYNSGYHVQWHGQRSKVIKAEPAKPQDAMAPVENMAQQESLVPTDAVQPMADASVMHEQKQETMTTGTVATVTNQPIAKVESPKAPKANAKVSDVKQEASSFKTSVSKGYTAQSTVDVLEKSSPLAEVDMIVLVILAILIPPLAVYLHSGIGTSFWISLILTLLFWIPGVIYSLLVVLDVI